MWGGGGSVPPTSSLVRLAYQPLTHNTFHLKQTSHLQPTGTEDRLVSLVGLTHLARVRSTKLEADYEDVGGFVTPNAFRLIHHDDGQAPVVGSNLYTHTHTIGAGYSPAGLATPPIFNRPIFI
jgi:hypothetical protein